MKPYRTMLTRALNKEVDFNSDTLMWTLHTSTYTPNLDTHQNVSDLTNELATSGGYTSGGLAASGLTISYVAANSWTLSRANSTAYLVGDVVRPATGNGFLYRCAVAGTSAGTIPTWLTVLGGSTTDGGVTWELVGSGACVFTCANPSWASATFGPCRYAVLSDRSTGVGTTEPLLGIVDFVTDRTAGNGTFAIQVNSFQGVLSYFIP
jgi:hypothetical protein